MNTPGLYTTKELEDGTEKAIGIPGVLPFHTYKAIMKKDRTIDSCRHRKGSEVWVTVFPYCTPVIDGYSFGGKFGIDLDIVIPLEEKQ
jgi:hypothetical protein